MKSKKALEIIRTYHNQISLLCKGKLNSRIINAEKQIEQDLDRLEQLEDNIKIHKETIKMQQNQIESLQSENDKLKKAIEILKKFNFNLNETRHNNSGFEIWTDSLLEYVELTQEEYELLKEVFENGK